MIKAVFFDWFNTLAFYQPTREEIQSQALKEFGIEVSPQQLAPGLRAADSYIYGVNVATPLREQSPEEQFKTYARYQQIMLNEAGVSVSNLAELTPAILRKARELMSQCEFVLFPDALPAVKSLDERELKLGVLTNLDADLEPLSERLGLAPFIDCIVTSGQVGFEKPQPQIFLAALERAGVEPAEAVHVGDQYRVDVEGARNAGIRPVLLDRDGAFPEITDCARISTLSELPSLIK